MVTQTVKKKIKVLIVADTFLPKRDGVVRYMLETANRLPKEKFQVSFLVPDIENSKKAAKDLPYKIYFCETTKFKINDYPSSIPKSALLERAIKPADIVYVQSIAPLGAATIILAKKMGKRVVEFVHSIDWKLLAYATSFPEKAIDILKPIVRYLYNKNDHIIVADRNTKQALKFLGVKTKMSIVPLGIDLKKFTPDPSKRMRMRAKLGLVNKFVIGYVGRLSPEKNIQIIVKAFKILKKRIKDSELLIVGGGAEKKHITGDIHTPGVVDNPEDYMRAMDVFVLPSRTETTALSLMEAMACGKPVIASAVGAIPTYVFSDINGILIEKNSINEHVLARAVKKLYDSPTLMLKLSRNATKTIRETYSWDKSTKELVKVLQEVMKEKPKKD